MKAAQKSILLYIAKCVTGVVVLFGLAAFVPRHVDLSWIIISMLLVLSPDNKEAIPLAIIRVKANLIASVSSILLLAVCPIPLIAICVAICITIVGCHMFKLMDGSRAALAAVIIISMHAPGQHLWTTAFERMLSVVLGCAFAMVLSFVFHREIPGKHILRSGGLNE